MTPESPVRAPTCPESRTTRPLLAPLALAVAALVWPGVASAQAAADTLRLTEAITQVRTGNPALAAARLAAVAAAERVRPAGSLPDPTLTLSVMNRPLWSLAADDGMTMNQVQLTQEFPWPGTLGRMRARESGLARAVAFDADESALVLVAEMQREYFTLAALDRSVTILEHTRQLLREFFDVTTARYAVGAAPQQDVLQAQVAVASLTEELMGAAQQRIAAAARLNALLGRAAGEPVPALEFPAIGSAPPRLDSLTALASRRRPAVQAAAERRRAAEAGVELARLTRYPDVMVGVAWGQRLGMADMGSLMVGFRLPVRPQSRQLPVRREMAAEAAREELMARDLINRTAAALLEARAEVERARTLDALYRTAILPQAEAAVEAALSAYRVGAVDYGTLADAQMTRNRYDLALVAITADYHRAMATLDALQGRTGDQP